MSRDAEPPNQSKRRRPGRFRRWALRPLVWTLTAVVALAFGLWLVLQSSWLQEKARHEIVTLLTERLDRQVQIGGLHFHLVPLSVELSDIRIADLDPALPPCVAVDELNLSADLFWRRKWQLDLHSLEAEHPVLRLRLLDDGGTNLPSFSRETTTSKQRLEVHIGSLALRHGEFVFEDRQLPLDLEAHDVRALLFGEAGLSAQGEAGAEQVQLTLPSGRPYLGTVSTRVRLDTGQLTILSSRVEGPHLQASARGVVTWGERRRASIQVQSKADGELLDELGYLEDEIRGAFELNGRVLWEPDSWGVRGAVRAKRASVFGWPLTDVQGKLAVDRNAAHIDVEQARFGGGRVTGSFAIDTRQKDSPSQLDLHLQDIGVDSLMKGLSIPVEHFNGRASGEFAYRFALTSPERGSGWAGIKVKALQTRPGTVALSGSVPVLLQAGTVHIGPLRLESPLHRLSGSGTYRLADQSGEFDLQVESSSVGRLRFLLPFDTETEPPLWLPRAGKGQLTAHLNLGGAGTRIHVGLDLTDVEAPGLTAAHASGAMELVEQGVTQMRLDLANPGAALLITGSVPFEASASGAAGPPLHVRLESAGWPVAAATPWLPTELPLDGGFTGSILLTGSLEQLSGQLDGRVDDVAVAGIRSGSLQADLEFDPQRLLVHQAAWSLPAGQISGSGSLRFADGALAVEVNSTALDAQREPINQIGLPGISGTVGFTAQVGGTLEVPDIRMEVDGSGLRVAGQTVAANGATHLTAHWADGKVELQASLMGLVEIEGGGDLSESSADLELHFHGDDPQRLLAALGLGLPATLEGEYRGVISVRQAEGENAPNVEMAIDRLTAHYQGQTLNSLEPIRLRLNPDALVVESLYLGSEDGSSDLFLGGRIRFADPAGLDLHMQGTIAASWLELFVPSVQMQGNINFLATIRGTTQKPLLNGEAAVEDGQVVLSNFPHSLDDVEALLLLYPDQVVLDHLAGRLAGGTVRLTGSARPDASQPLGFGYRLQADAKGLEMRYPEDWRVRGGMQLVLSSTPEGRNLRGVVQVDQALYVRDLRVGPVQLLQDFLRRNPQRLAETDETLRSTQLQVQITGPGALRVRNNLANLTGDIDLVLRGSLARPILFGKIVVDPESTITYGGNEYTVVRGELNFANPYRIDPYVDVVAEATIREYDVTLDLSGSLERPNASFSSNPPLADLDVLALLTTGRTGETAQLTPEGTRASGAAEGFLYGQAAGLVAQRVNNLFGLDKFQIDPLTGNSGNLSSARVTVGKQLSKNVLATYSYDPSTTEVQILQVEWHLSRTLALILTQNGDNTYAVDAKWEKRF